MQVIVGAGLLGGLAVGFMKVNEMQSRSVGQFGARTEANETFRRLTTLLADSEICTQSVIQNTIGEDDFKVYNPEGTDYLMQTGDVINNVIEITNMRTEEYVTPNSYPGWGHINFHIEMNRLGAAGQRERPINRKTTLRVRYDSDGEVISCHGLDETIVITAMSEMCDLLGGDYNESPERCTLEINCEALDDSSSAGVAASVLCLNRLREDVDLRGKSCSPNQYVQGIQANGELICSPLPAP